MGRINIFGVEIDYQPFQDQLYMDRLKIKLANNPSYRRVFKYNKTDQFFALLRDTVNPEFKHEENMILQIYGGTGTGKSIIAMSLCRKTVPERFSHENVVFFDNDILDMAKEFPKNSFVIRDEGVDKAIYGVGSGRQTRQLQLLVETARKHGFNIIFIEPEFRENEMAKYYLETVDMDLDKRITRCALIEPNSKEYIGAVYIPVLEDDDKDWILYNEKKDYFIEQVKSGKLTGSKQDYRDLAVEVTSKIDTEIFKTKTDRLAFIQSQYPNFTNNEIKIIQTFTEAVLKYGEHAIYDRDEEEEESESESTKV